MSETPSEKLLAAGFTPAQSLAILELIADLWQGLQKTLGTVDAVAQHALDTRAIAKEHRA